jgi:uncharacterized protein
MKKLLLILVLAFVSSNAMAECVDSSKKYKGSLSDKDFFEQNPDFRLPMAGDLYERYRCEDIGVTIHWKYPDLSLEEYEYDHKNLTHQMTYLLDYDEAQKIDGKQYKSVEKEYVFDCKNKQQRILSTTIFRNNMGKGDPTLINGIFDNWQTIFPGSIEEKLWESASGQDCVSGAARENMVVAMNVFNGNSYLWGRDGVPQDYQKALKSYRFAAERRDAYAQLRLGEMYYFGQGVQRDSKEAVKWFRKAAEQGRADAKFNLARMYHVGEVVIQDNKKAAGLYRFAAEQGHVKAQFNLGVIYEKGDGVSQDHKEALQWYRMASDQGFSSAQRKLGWIYETGQGVIQDYKEAMKWYRLAAEQGDAEAQNDLAKMYWGRAGDISQEDLILAHMWFNLAASAGSKEAKSSREFLSYEMTPAQIIEAQKKAKGCLKKKYKNCD